MPPRVGIAEARHRVDLDRRMSHHGPCVSSIPSHSSLETSDFNQIKYKCVFPWQNTEGNNIFNFFIIGMMCGRKLMLNMVQMLTYVSFIYPWLTSKQVISYPARDRVEREIKNVDPVPSYLAGNTKRLTLNCSMLYFPSSVVTSTGTDIPSPLLHVITLCISKCPTVFLAHIAIP